jgi:NAD(P)H dehydrogenase (quinone)
MTVKIATVYWSGYGHTKKLAQAIHEGVGAQEGVEAHLFDAEDLQEADALAPLDDCDAILFGTPTYMGGPAAKFKGFIDAASGRWLEQRWKDKVAGGFTNSGSMAGDKQGCLQALHVNAMQHGMIWVGQGEMPAQSGDDGAPDKDQVNRIGSFIGVMAKSANGSPEGPSKGDLETGRIYGGRVATVTKQLKQGRDF